MRATYILLEKKAAREGYFKLHEGKPGDGIVALYDRPDSRLRLYCIRYGSVTLIVGGGGAKPKSVRAWQEVPELARSVKKTYDDF